MTDTQTAPAPAPASTTLRDTSRSASRTGSRTASASSWLANVALCGVTVCTAIGFCRIFADWAFLGPMLVVALGVHAAASLLRWLRAPGWIALPATAAIGFELMVVEFYRDTLRLLLPSSESISLLRVDLRLVWQQFPAAAAPVPSTGQFVVTVTLALAVAALLADAFAFRALGRAEAAVPTGVLFVFTAALGTERNRVPVAALWLGVSVVAVALLRRAHRDTQTTVLGPARARRWTGAVPAIVVCGALAAAAGAVVAPRLPGAGDQALLDTSQSGDVTEVVSPLVDIRSRLVNRSQVQLFTVQSQQARYWRLTDLSAFDGTTWSLPDRPLVDVDGRFATVARDGGGLRQRIEINRLGGSLVPAAYSPAAAVGDGLAWVEDSGTLVAAGATLSNGQVIDVVSAVVDPPADVLRAATSDASPDPGDLQLPASFPADVTKLAAEVVGGATAPYERALALQDWFRTNFTYDLNVQSGHSDDAIRSFLRIRRGYCEQFAGTFAAMARSIGLPARVAVGFTPGTLEADGRYHVFGRNAHAWPEVWFDGVGWVSFEPTPGRGEPGAEGRTGVQPAQDDIAPVATGTGDQTTTTVAASTVTSVATTDSTVEASPTDPAPELAPELIDASSDGGSGGGGGGGAWRGPSVVAGLIAVVAAWMTLMPIAIRRRALRRSASPDDRVIAAWHQAIGALTLAGTRPPDGSTPIEFAASAELEGRVDRRPVAELARHVTAAVYSPGRTDEETAERCDGLRQRIQHAASQVTPWRARLLARLDPRWARLRATG